VSDSDQLPSRLHPQAANYTRAHEELARVPAGDATPNNPLRAH
jgi:hypothetical protein